MYAVRPITLDSSPDHLGAARLLFEAYGEFLRGLLACATFNFDRFTAEIAGLPAAYSEHGGELLLAFSEDGAAAGCIAYRHASAHALPPAMTPACELKRLFVPHAFRGQGIGDALLQAALLRASERGYLHAILDTEPSSMASALALYRRHGFQEFSPQQRTNPVDVVYLSRKIL